MKKFTFLFVLIFSLQLYGGDCREFTLTKKGLICTENPHRLRNQIIANTLVIASNAIDCHMSVKSVKAGHKELNPIMRPFSNSFGKCFAFKSVLGVPTMIYGWKNDSIKGQIIFSSISFGVAIHSSFRF